MKKMLLATALGPAYAGDVLNRRLLLKTTGSSSTRWNYITHHFSSFWNWVKKTVDAAKICGGAENVTARFQQTFGEMDCSVLLL